MRVEELNRRVVIQRRTAVKDDTGAVTDTWVNVFPGTGKRWARIKDQTGRQYMAARADQNAVITEIGMRQCAGLEAKMRVVHGAAIYDIEAVLDSDKTWIFLMCNRGVSNG